MSNWMEAFALELAAMLVALAVIIPLIKLVE